MFQHILDYTRIALCIVWHRMSAGDFGANKRKGNLLYIRCGVVPLVAAATEKNVTRDKNGWTFTAKYHFVKVCEYTIQHHHWHHHNHRTYFHCFLTPAMTFICERRVVGEKRAGSGWYSTMARSKPYLRHFYYKVSDHTNTTYTTFTFARLLVHILSFILFFFNKWHVLLAQRSPHKSSHISFVLFFVLLSAI